MARIQKKLKNTALMLWAALMMAGCTSLMQPDTSLYGQGTHTGTLTLLRVDHNWAPDVPIWMSLNTTDAGSMSEPCAAEDIGDTTKCYIADWRRSQLTDSGDGKCRNVLSDGPQSCNDLRRFVPMRHKDDVEGLDLSEFVVDETEDVLVTLNYAFIKYFQEQGKNPSGEIAMVLSFDSGDYTPSDNIKNGVINSFLVYSSQGQTLGSFLDFQDWIAIGPVKVKAAGLSIRITLIEVDRIENAKNQQFIRALAQTAGALVPDFSGIVPLVAGVADTVISNNVDDVVFDQRFTLKRVKAGENMFRSPLLYGKYVAISQEDALANNDADERFPLSTSAPPVPDLRYDLHSDRLYMTYPYLPDEFDLISDGIAPLNGPLPISKYPFWESDNTCNLDEEHLGLIREKEGNVITLQRRKHVLGYGRDGRIGLRSFCSRNRALYEAFLHSYRGEMNKTSEENLKGNETKFFDDSGKIEIPTNNNLYPYRVVDYPQAGVLLGQYPLHTHISFTIEEALGHAGNPYHERFPEYQTYLEQQIASVRENTALASLAELFGETIIAMRKRDIAVEWIKANASAEPVKKACMLSKSLVPANSNVALGNEYVFNKLRKATGQIFSSIDEVHAYIRTNAGDSLDVSAEEDDFTCDIRSSDDG